MSKILGNKAGQEICKVLGLDPTNITRVDILLRAQDVGRVEITRFIDSTELEGIKEVLEKYEVTAIKEVK